MKLKVEMPINQKVSLLTSGPDHCTLHLSNSCQHFPAILNKLFIKLMLQ